MEVHRDKAQGQLYQRVGRFWDKFRLEIDFE